MSRFKYEVIGGADKGSISVRTGKNLKSPEEKLRLAKGSLVKELELSGDRLHYELLEGEGPVTGWVSMKVKGKDMLKRTGREPKKVKAAEEAEADEPAVAQTEVGSSPPESKADAGAVAGPKAAQLPAALPVYPSVTALPPTPQAIVTRTVCEDPRMVLLRDFVTPGEAELLVSLAKDRWQRAALPESNDRKSNDEWKAVGKKKKSGSEKTSASLASPSSAETVHIGWKDSEIVARILARVASLTKSPLENVGQLMLVRYHAGERFTNEYSGAQWPMTIVSFLNDVPAGGELLFAKAGKKISPVACSALMWSNARLSGDKVFVDKRLAFESLEVGKGCMKYELHCNVSHAPQWNCDHIRILQEAS